MFVFLVYMRIGQHMKSAKAFKTLRRSEFYDQDKYVMSHACFPNEPADK